MVPNSKLYLKTNSQKTITVEFKYLEYIYIFFSRQASAIDVPEKKKKWLFAHWQCSTSRVGCVNRDFMRNYQAINVGSHEISR